ncbi:hypothetical protein G5C51_29690 [Streptomyces sp. A7024]|uniref:Uncharacterized protein n=1 Tax=Streptomyces coryli TaxID=1128680 RepID=A0A6G4U8K8_9ACTN|nr:hypothetical protein [Streptomyces coryli]NGN68060.1 hypothetical protein [Streptomyces coryli]
MPSATSALVTAATTTRTALAALRRRPPGGAALWERKNFAGRHLDLLGGPAAATGALAAAATAPGLRGRTRAAAVLATAVAGGIGAYDDLAGRDDARRGFRAHLAALRQGELTTGGVKLLGIGAAGLAAGALLKDRPLDRLLAGVVIAGSAHAVNLLDVRPARATAATVALAAPGLLRGGEAATLSAVPAGAAAAVLPDDVAQHTMIGDAGAHALGASLGVAIAAGNGRTGLALHAAVVVAAAVYGERALPG